MLHLWPYLACSLAAFCAEQNPIATDRPDFTESSVVVPIGSLQLESGMTHERTTSGRSLGLPEMLFRYGVAHGWEVRLGAPNYSRSKEGGLTISGWGDAYVGAKRQLGPTTQGDDLALIVFTYIPTGEDGFGADVMEPGMNLCFSRELSDRDTLSAMVSVLWPGVGRSRPECMGTISLGRSIGPQTAAFLEYAGTFRLREWPGHVIHGGFVFQPNSDSQWDLHFGASPWSDQNEFFVGFGYSMRTR